MEEEEKSETERIMRRNKIDKVKEVEVEEEKVE